MYILLFCISNITKYCSSAGGFAMLMMMFTSTSTDWLTFWQISDETSLFISDVQEQNQENHGGFYQVDKLRLVWSSFSFPPLIFAPSLPPSFPHSLPPSPTEAKLGTPGTPYHFAVGGMYCLSRTLLDKARRWIG